jgi:hypothetical protein
MRFSALCLLAFVAAAFASVDITVGNQELRNSLAAAISEYYQSGDYATDYFATVGSYPQWMPTDPYATYPYARYYQVQELTSDGTMANIIDTEAINICVGYNFAPIYDCDDDGVIDPNTFLSKMIPAVMDIMFSKYFVSSPTVNTIRTDFGDFKTALESGTCDMVWSGVSITNLWNGVPRVDVFNFTNGFVIAGEGVLAAVGTDLSTVNNLDTFISWIAAEPTRKACYQADTGYGDTLVEKLPASQIIAVDAIDDANCYDIIAAGTCTAVYATNFPLKAKAEAAPADFQFLEFPDLWSPAAFTRFDSPALPSVALVNSYATMLKALIA